MANTPKNQKPVKATLLMEVTPDGSGNFAPAAVVRFDNGAELKLPITEWTSAPGQVTTTFKADLDLTTAGELSSLTKAEVDAQRKAEQEAMMATVINVAERLDREEGAK
jgi:hypothetical protein